MSVEQMIDSSGLPPKMSRAVNEFSQALWDLVRQSINEGCNAGLIVATLDLVRFQLLHMTCHEVDE